MFDKQYYFPGAVEDILYIYHIFRNEEGLFILNI